jgi:hypothetical protein
MLPSLIAELIVDCIFIALVIFINYLAYVMQNEKSTARNRIKPSLVATGNRREPK